VVLRPGVTEDDLDDVALDAGWVLIGTKPADDLAPYRTVWDDEESGTEVSYIWDDLVSLAYVSLRYGETAAAEAIIRSGVGTFGLEDMLDDIAAAETGEFAVNAVCRIAVSRPDPDSRILSQLRRLAHSSDRMVRVAVVTAIGYLEWAPLLMLLKEMRAADSDPVVRREAGIVLSGIQGGTPPSPQDE
jgi:hypothetical protein